MTGTVKLKKNILERSALLIMALNAVWKTTKRHFSSLLFSPPYSCTYTWQQHAVKCKIQHLVLSNLIKKVKIFTTNNFWTRAERTVVKIESRLMNNTQIFVCHTWHTFDSNVRSITTTSGQFFKAQRNTFENEIRRCPLLKTYLPPFNAYMIVLWRFGVRE